MNVGRIGPLIVVLLTILFASCGGEDEEDCDIDEIRDCNYNCSRIVNLNDGFCHCCFYTDFDCEEFGYDGGDCLEGPTKWGEPK